MADMRLIVAGAGGRMGRALTRVISDTPGAVLAGALEAPGSELLGKDAGTLAGLSSSDDAVIKSVTSRAIVVKSGNMSLGVNLLAALVKRVAQSLDTDFDIEILEMHHRAKIDAPSGTALMLGEAAAAGRKIALDQHSARGRGAISALPRCVAAASPATTA